MRRIVLTLSQSDFAMVQEFQSRVERDSQAVVDLSKDNSQVCIFGKKENVGIAQALIVRMVKKDNSISPCIDIRLQGGHDESGFHEGSEFSYKNGSSISGVDFMKENGSSTCGDVTENTNLSSLKQRTVESANKVSDVSVSGEKRPQRAHAALKRTMSVGVGPLSSTLTEPKKIPLTKTMSYGNELRLAESSLSRLKLSHQSSTSSDEEETTDEEEYNTKIEFALKLGYSELQLASVLKKLGNKAGQNEILSELIKLSTTCVDRDSKSSDEGSSGFCAIDGSSENLLTFTPENCFDLSDSSSNFRPIVIDGSNVAMRFVQKSCLIQIL